MHLRPHELVEQGIAGRPLRGDAVRDQQLALFRQPVVVFVGSMETGAAAHGRARARELPVAVFTSELFGTGNDRDPILLNVGSTTPNSVRVQQLP